MSNLTKPIPKAFITAFCLDGFGIIEVDDCVQQLSYGGNPLAIPIKTLENAVGGPEKLDELLFIIGVSTNGISRNDVWLYDKDWKPTREAAVKRANEMKTETMAIVKKCIDREQARFDALSKLEF